MKYFYIHGFNATGKTTAKLLSKVLETKVEVLAWDCTKPFNENFENMLKILKKESDDFLLIGSSMGGFYANSLANELCVNCVLFNPVIEPKEVLKRFQKEAAEILTDELINSYEGKEDKILSRVVVVGLNDEVLNPQKTIEYWQGKCNLITTNDGHEIKDFAVVKEDIINLTQPVSNDCYYVSSNKKQQNKTCEKKLMAGEKIIQALKKQEIIQKK